MDQPSRSVLAPPPERFVPEELGGTLLAAEHLARYWWAAGAASGADVLDAGCGVGFGTKLLLDAGARSAVGVDASEEAVAAARERCGEAAAFQVAQLEQLPLEGDSIDLAVCFEVLEHVERPERAIAELRRVLRPSGTLAVSTPNGLVSATENPHHHSELSPSELRAALVASFAHVEPLAQQSWYASVLAGPAARGGDPAQELDLAVRSETAPKPDEETYLVAVAGDGPPPPELTRGVAFLAEPRGPERLDDAVSWHARRSYVERARAERAEAEAEALRRELASAREQLSSSPPRGLLRRARGSLRRR